MNKIIGLAATITGGLLLAGCVTYPYETAFSSCEREANACYRLCEEIPDEGGYVACQSHCDRDIDRCFDTAYSPYRSGYYSGYSSYSSPWYGRYGTWYPDSGFFLSLNFYDRYGYRARRHPPKYHRNYGGNRNGYRNNGRYDDRRGYDGRRYDRRRGDNDRVYFQLILDNRLKYVHI